MKKTKKAISLLLALVLVVSMMSVAMVSASAADNPYSDAAMALDREYAYDGELGALYSPESTTFKVWAPLASEVALNRYATGSDSEAGAQDLGTVPMEKLMDGGSWTGVWTATVEGDIVNTYYTYTITNPQHIYNSAREVTHETQDIYSYAVGVNGNRSMVVDLSATDPEGWDSDAHVFVDHQTDAIIWEIQVKDFSYNPNSGVSEANRGKYLAFTETGTTLNNEGLISTGIDYLKQLGVTHVQINPFYDFATIDEERNVTDDSEFNWGYDPKNYGVPEGSYSSNPFDGNVRIKEAKEMIQALHNAGIGVIMDVVYNHTYSVDSCFNYSVPEYYYRMAADGSYSQQSGCGNDTASERAMYRKYMREMLNYWTNEYHIDGYRFDLMGVHDGETMNMIREDMDAIDSRIIMYGEGWAGNTVYDPYTCSGTETFMTTQTTAAQISERIGFFNDQIRDGIKGGVFDGLAAKGFVSGSKISAPEVYMGLRANTVGKGRWSAVSPEQCVTYASCHDNMTLYDKLVGANYGSGKDFRARYADVIAQNKLTAGIISSSQGIDFILAGEEMGRSKDGDENSYRSSPLINMIDWSLLETNADLVSYYKGMFELRKAFSPFTAELSSSKGGAYKYYFDTSGSVDTMAYTVDNNTEGEWSKIAVIYNGKTRDFTYTFKARTDTSITKDTEWVIVANDKTVGVTKLGEVTGLSFDVPASTMLVAVEKSSFEACNLASSFSKINVNNVYEATGEVLSSSVVIGKPGEGYSVSADTSIAPEYELAGVDGDVQGIFGETDKTVTFNFADYVPTSFKAANGDVDDSGEVDLIDAAVLQRFFAKMRVLDAEHIARGDYDVNDATNIIDVTVLQYYIAKMIKPVYTVTARHYGVDDNGTVKSLGSPVVTRVRYGDPYQTAPVVVDYYKLDATPENASGIVRKNVDVDYYYSYSVKSPIMHVKHNGSDTWKPNLWAWAYRGNNPANEAINCYDGWPGLQLTNIDDDGWYDVTFPIPGGLDYYFIISKAGSPQTMDYGPIPYDDYPEIWVVIDDANVGKGSDWIKYYNYLPEV